MKEKIQVINNVLLRQQTIAERKAYLENLGDEYQHLLTADDVFLDTRDYTFYSIVSVAGREWLGENIRYATEEGSYAYNDDSDHVLTHGRLYTAAAAQAACPPGWEVPNNKAWMDLLEALGGYYDAYYDKHIGAAPNTVTAQLLPNGSSGLDLTPGGKMHRQVFEGIDKEGFYWSTSPFYKNGGETIVYVWKDYNDITLNEAEGGPRAFSLRCLRPTSSRNWVAQHNQQLLALPDQEARQAYLEQLGPALQDKIAAKQVFLDERDATLYSIVKIGDQHWLGENLHYDHRRATVYQNKTDPAFIAQYGRLYAPRYLQESCPEGCKIPSLKDYEVLLNNSGVKAEFNDSDPVIKHPKLGANLTQRGNSGFEALYGGIQFRESNQFTSFGSRGYFWTNDQDWDYGSHYYISFEWSDGAYVYHEEHYDPIMASCRVLLKG